MRIVKSRAGPSRFEFHDAPDRRGPSSSLSPQQTPAHIPIRELAPRELGDVVAGPPTDIEVLDLRPAIPPQSLSHVGGCAFGIREQRVDVPPTNQRPWLKRDKPADLPTCGSGYPPSVSLPATAGGRLGRSNREGESRRPEAGFRMRHVGPEGEGAVMAPPANGSQPST